MVLVARDESATPFGQRSIPPGSVSPHSHSAGIPPLRTSLDRHLTLLSAKPNVHRRLFAITAQHATHDVEVLRSIGGLPAHIVGQFREPSVFQRSEDGQYFVFDRRAQRVSRIDRNREIATTIVDIGPEQGRIIGASSFDLGSRQRFVVADPPNGRERVQIFDVDGHRVGGFTLPGRAAPRITLDNVVLNGIGSLQFTGQTILMNQPELGGLITKFNLGGQPFHTFGVFRQTGHEGNRDVHLALNTGLPLVAPGDRFYFVFQAGVPMFRKYNAAGALLFERHVEGPELDPIINNLPTNWPRHLDSDGRMIPLIPPTVRTATVDPDGNLWIALSVPYLYVYNPNGEKIRTVRLQAAGKVQPNSLFFADRARMLVTPGCYEFRVW